jgi:hypothetical protein
MELMTDTSKTTPRRVLRRAAELGAHADCIAADLEGACEICVDIMHSVFSEYYGHAESPGDAIYMIIEDIMNDRGPITGNDY